MRARDMLSFGVFALIIVFALQYFTSLGVRVQSPQHRTNLSMDVADINGLVVGANVLLRGVPVGEVTKVSATIDRATVEFYIDDQYKIPADSEVRLENLSALGESYIGFLPHSEAGPVFRDGQRIATSAVTQPPSISEMAASVSRVLQQIDPGALHRIIAEADTGLPDATAVLPNLSRTSMLLRKTANSMNGKGRDLLDNFQTLLRNAEFVGPALADIARPLPQIGQDTEGQANSALLLAQHGAPETVQDFVAFLKRTLTFLDHRSPDIKVVMQTLLPYMNEIAGALMNFDTGQFLDNMLTAVPEDGAVTLHVSVPPS